MPELETARSRIVDISGILPHRRPFVFVDRARLVAPESLWAVKRIDEADFEFFRPDSRSVSYTYPREILLEHAAQSMMLLGHHYGRDIGWLPDGYKSIGLLTTVEDFTFFGLDIRPGDEVVTEVDVTIEKRALYYLGVRARISVGGELAAEGSVCGMFLTGQYDDLFGSIGEFRPLSASDHPHFSFVDRNDRSLYDSSYWYLKGHFPGSPCIPGCTFIRGVVELADPSLELRRIVRAKFKKIAVPHKRYRYKIERSGGNVSFSIVDAQSGELHARGALELGPRGN